MPRPPPYFLRLRALNCTRLQSRSFPRHVQESVRRCSGSAPQRLHVSTPSASQLNPTTANPRTPRVDHRSLAKTHDLFITSPYSPGSPLLLPNGAYVFHKLQAFLRAQYPQFGFQEVLTPTIYKKSLWEKSGHWENYAEDMFSVQGRGATGQTEDAELGQDEEFGLKPMNCPGHCLLFRDEIKSFRDLPIRYADFSALHRNEISGSLSGLTRVRRFHQDDAHIFCRPDQILAEIKQTLTFVGMVYDTFGLGPYKLLLSTRPKDHFIGTIEEWDKAEEQLTIALNNSGREWAVNEGDGAFYGPKIDIILKDSQGKEHQTATIQLDFQLPQRFDLQYQASPEELEATSNRSEETSEGINPSHRRPVMIHRAIYGSFERFMALLIEHYAGTYPFWLSPRPAIILALSQDERVLSHVSRLQGILSGVGSPSQTDSESSTNPRPLPLSTIQLPIDVDTSSRTLSKKLAEVITKRYNHAIVIGSKEAEDGSMMLQTLNQPNMEAAEQALSHALGGRDISASERKRTGLSIKMQPDQVRTYFEKLVYSYL